MADKGEKDEAEVKVQEDKEATDDTGWTKVVGGRNFGHPIYKDIAKINGYINRQHKKQTIDELKSLGLDHRGNKEVVQKRLKAYYKKEKVKEAKLQKEEKDTSLDYYCVIDFEGTCEEENPDDYIHEIIEFPAVLINAKTFEIEDEFQEYCRPLVKTELSNFCTTLTGISQETVDKADPFPDVLKRFLEWVEKNKLGTEKKFIIVTDGSWDINKCLAQQCLLCSVPVPPCARKWIDLRRHYRNFYKLKGNLETMLSQLGMDFEGRQHCGLDDAKNIARILVKMIEDGCPMVVNGRLRF